MHFRARSVSAGEGRIRENEERSWKRWTASRAERAAAPWSATAAETPSRPAACLNRSGVLAGQRRLQIAGGQFHVQQGDTGLHGLGAQLVLGLLARRQVAEGSKRMVWPLCSTAVQAAGRARHLHRRGRASSCVPRLFTASGPPFPTRTM